MALDWAVDMVWSHQSRTILNQIFYPTIVQDEVYHNAETLVLHVFGYDSHIIHVLSIYMYVYINLYIYIYKFSYIHTLQLLRVCIYIYISDAM